MADSKLYLLRVTDECGTFYFKSVSGDGLEASFLSDLQDGYRFTKEGMADFRRTHSHIKGRAVLLSREIERIGS